jgi:hypothetical protein
MQTSSHAARIGFGWPLFLAGALLSLSTSTAFAQMGTTAVSGGGSSYGWQSGAAAPGYTGSSYVAPSKTRSANEMTLLYATSIAYGFGMGVEISAEASIKDPGLFLIAPAVLGIAAPIGAYALDQPKMHRGVPAAISAGLLLGAGEGLGIAGTQMVTARSDNAWKFRGLARATALGATIGGVGGWLAGTWLEPPPSTSVLALSGAVWGTAIGSMFGYGVSPGNYSYGRANDWAAVGGLIGYNLGAVGAAGLGTVTLVSDYQIAWMWAGGGIGAAASLPIFLFYAGDGGPPARRGFVFMGTAATLGVAAGAVFSARGSGVARTRSDMNVARAEPPFEVLGVLPWWNTREGGLVALGTFR